MNIIKYLTFSLGLTLISIVTVAFLPSSVVGNKSESVYSPYIDEIIEFIEKDRLNSDEKARLDELTRKNDEWFQRERNIKSNKVEEHAFDENFSYFLQEKSKHHSVVILIIWALTSYLFLHNKVLFYSPIILLFPMLTWMAGYFHIIALLAVTVGVLITMLTIKFINPSVGRIGNKK